MIDSLICDTDKLYGQDQKAERDQYPPYQRHYVIQEHKHATFVRSHISIILTLSLEIEPLWLKELNPPFCLVSFITL